jgi:hypothetical protein
MKKKSFIMILIAVVAILLIPFTAMLFTSEVDWGPFDFMVMGLLLTGTGVVCEFAVRKIKKIEHQLAACGMIFILFLLIWAELAVGIFGSALAGS